MINQYALTYFSIGSAVEKEVAVYTELRRLTANGQLTTAADMARMFEVTLRQILQLVETKGGEWNVSWQSLPGMWGTLLYPANASVVELLHRNWQALRRENVELTSRVDALQKQLEEAPL